MRKSRWRPSSPAATNRAGRLTIWLLKNWPDNGIRSEGLMQPIVVRKVGEKFQLIAGERRWRACQLLNLKVIVARIVEASDVSSAVMTMIENLQRADLNPIEEAVGYASLVRDFSLTQDAVAERVGKARATITNALRLLGLEREVQGYLAKGLLSSGHAKVLCLGWPMKRSVCCWPAGLWRRAGVCANSNARPAGPSRRRRFAPVAGWPRRRRPRPSSMSKKRLAAKLNTRVSLKHTPKRGRIVIEYFGNEDLQRILETPGRGHLRPGFSGLPAGMVPGNLDGLTLIPAPLWPTSSSPFSCSSCSPLAG